MRPLIGRILASFPRLVADAFSPHPVETIFRPFSAALGPQVSKPTFGGTGVSDCTVREPLDILEALKLQIGSDAFSAQYQQAPMPPGGAMVKRHWVKRMWTISPR